MPVASRARPGPRPRPRPHTLHVASTDPPLIIGLIQPLGYINAMLSRRPQGIFSPHRNVPLSSVTPQTVAQIADNVMSQSAYLNRLLRSILKNRATAWITLQGLYNYTLTFYHLAQRVHIMFKYLPQVERIAQDVNCKAASSGPLQWASHFTKTFYSLFKEPFLCLKILSFIMEGAAAHTGPQLLPQPNAPWGTAYVEEKTAELRNHQFQIECRLVHYKFICMVKLEDMYTDGDSDDYSKAMDAANLFWGGENIHDLIKDARGTSSDGAGPPLRTIKGQKDKKSTKKRARPASANDNTEGTNNTNTTQAAASAEDMYAALAQSNFVTAINLLRAGTDVNVMLQDGTFVLSHAVDNNNGALVSLLALYGANPNVRHRSGSTPLHFASHINCVAPALVLLEMGAEVDARDAHGLTPLHVACRERHLPIIVQLLAHGADPNVHDDRGITPLGYALLHPRKAGMNHDIIKALLTYGARATGPGHALSPVAEAVLRHKVGQLDEYAVDGPFSVDSETVVATAGAKNGGIVRLRPLYFALLSSKDYYYTDRLITDGADMLYQTTMYGESLSYLSIAVHSQCAEHVARLLVQGADPNEADRHGVTPLHIAASLPTCDVKIVNLLIGYGADCKAKTNERRIQPLHSAARAQRADICVPLIEYGASVNAPLSSGVSPLMLAVYGGSKSVLRFLISKGADVRYHTPAFGETAMHTACRVGNSLLAAYLLEEGLSVNATYGFAAEEEEASTAVEQSCRGYAPIHIAAARGHLGVVQWLLKNGADAEARIGCTAARICLSSMIEEYRPTAGGGEASGGEHEKHDLGLTPAQVALACGHAAVASCIEKHIEELAQAAKDGEALPAANTSTHPLSTQTRPARARPSPNYIDASHPPQPIHESDADYAIIGTGMCVNA